MSTWRRDDASTASRAALVPRISAATIKEGAVAEKRRGFRPTGPRAPDSKVIAAHGAVRARGPVVISRLGMEAAARKETSSKRARAAAWGAPAPGAVSAGAGFQSAVQ